MGGAEFPVKAVLDDKGIEMLIAALTKAGKEAGKTDKEIEEMNETLKKTGKEGVSSVNKINTSLDGFVNNTLKKVGTAFIAAFAVDRLLAIGKAVVDITAEFQKFEAVLTNTLGSKSRAQLALQQIQKFASQTPFSVKELTESFVRLANQGFVPTTNELRKLGDLASSTGKGFDQLTEAIIDAQTGEFERLKEFGIRASKEGDKVKFTFKGVQTQTDFTSESIRKYVLSLGDMAGVSGAMSAISATLGGRISNLGDAWDTFLKTVGDGSNGVLTGTVTLLSKAIEKATELLKTDEQRAQDTATAVFENYKALKTEQEQVDLVNSLYARQYVLVIQKAKAEKDYLNTTSEARRAYSKGIIEDSRRDLDVIKNTLGFIADYKDQLKEAEEAAKKQKPLTKEELDAREKIRKEWEKQQLAVVDEERAEIERATRQKMRDEEEYKRLLKMTGVTNVAPSATDEFGNVVVDESDGRAQDLKDLEKYYEDKEALDKAYAENRIATQQYVRDALISFANELYELEAANLAAQGQAIEQQRDYELELAGDNTEAKKKINKRFDEEQRALKTKQAQADKEQAVFNILLSTGQGIVAALASVPPNVPLSVAIGVVGGIQAGLAASRKVPKFKDGVFNLDGPGTGTSDSISAMLSKGETVVPADKTAANAWWLKPFVEDNLSLLELRELIDSKVPTHLRGDIMRPASATDSNALLLEMRETRKAIENKKETYIDIDENGFSKWTRQGSLWTQYVNKRYRS